MINGILNDIFYDEALDEIRWPEFEYKGFYNGYTNIECEKEFGFEFIDLDTKVGYRYTYVKVDEVDSLLSREDIDSICIILWEPRGESGWISYGNKPIRSMNFYDLFHESFFDLEEDEIEGMYDLFITRVSDAVKQANSMISLSTLPGFSPLYLHSNRKKLVKKLEKEIGELSCFSVKDTKFKMNESNSKELIDTYKLSQVFLTNGFEKALVGTTDFAKSFLTSEYLHLHFKDNPLFDYTPIVCGYLKSIEQLLHTVNSTYAALNNIQRDYSEYTLATYIRNLSKDRVFKRELIPTAKRYIIDCLNSYRVENRNKLFHKDYIDSWDKVELIRKNTIFLLVVIISSIDPIIVKSNPAVLGILPMEYDQLFTWFDKKGGGTFSFVLNGKEYFGLYPKHRFSRIRLNEYGLIMNSIEFEGFSCDDYENVEISRSNMPQKIFQIDSSGNKQQIWPIENNSFWCDETLEYLEYLDYLD